jgi:hypothetical protein
VSLLTELLAGVENTPASRLRAAGVELQKELALGLSYYPDMNPTAPRIVAMAFAGNADRVYSWVTLELESDQSAQVVLWQRPQPTGLSRTEPVGVLAFTALLRDEDVQNALQLYVRILHARGAVQA